MPETTEDQPEDRRIVINGRVLRDPYCAICQPAMRGSKVATPYHEASADCKSGKHEHCSCDTCF